MDFRPAEEHTVLRRAVREFAETRIAPHAAEWDRSCHFPVDVVQAMGELGLFGIVFPERWGGGGGDFAALCVAIEELGRVDQSMGITLSAGVGLGVEALRDPLLSPSPKMPPRTEASVDAQPPASSSRSSGSPLTFSRRRDWACSRRRRVERPPPPLVPVITILSADPGILLSLNFR